MRRPQRWYHQVRVPEENPIEHRCTRGGRGSTSCTPSKHFETFGHKNAIKHKNREIEDPLNFHTPPNQYSPSKEQKNLKTTVHLCN
jgi:hypothetical protein